MKYIVTIPVVKCHGLQTWQVEAESEAEAIAKIRNGEVGTMIDEDISGSELDFDGATAESEHDPC